MRAFAVDERDSQWEDDAPRFRVYVFEGAKNAVTTTDVVGATAEQALEAARALALDDRHLWSLALVRDDGRMGRGLVWLSGNDYNDTHSSADETAAYWRARGAMQTRYLMARDRAGEPVVLPNGERSIRVFPEWSTELPLWESFTDNYPVARGALSLSGDLENALADWNERWQVLTEPDRSAIASADEWAEWHEQGRTLVAHLRTALAGRAEVRPEFLTDELAGG